MTSARLPAVPGAERLPESVRVAVVQYPQQAVSGFADFAERVEHYVAVAADYAADLVVFPEMFTLQLLSAGPAKLPGPAAVAALGAHTDALRELFADLARRHRVNLVGGSHIHPGADGAVHNTCVVARRDGSLDARRKIHATPSERAYWGVTGGDSADVVSTDVGPIGIAICYDSEFPELARHLVAQGAWLLAVPFCTDVREGWLRVRYSCHARAIENQIAVALAGNVGNLPRVGNMDIQYAQSAVLTPCDVGFARDGIAVDTSPNVEMVAFADLRPRDLLRARETGSVRNLADRRLDLYSTVWDGPRR